MGQKMLDKTLPRAEFGAELLRTLLANAPAAMELAEQYGVCPGEARSLIHEALLHSTGTFRNSGEDMPILAQPPGELRKLSPDELQMLLGDYSTFKQQKTS